MAAVRASSQHEGGSSVTLQFHGASVRTARERLRTELGSRFPPGRIEDARMVVSELVANSLRHARPLAGDTIDVRWSVRPDALRLSVTDGGSLTTAPQPRCAGDLATGGRGLMIVESLARRWGVESEDGGTTVWAELDVP
jgi:anti-sigma regulatory factor (Ser/Thr protein kinase)